jgi:hypothetical protein
MEKKMPLYPCIRDSKPLREAYARFLENEAARALGRKTQKVPCVPVHLEGPFESITNYEIVTVVIYENRPSLVLLMDIDGKQQFVVVDPLEDSNQYRVTAIDRKIDHRDPLGTIQRLLRL